MNRCSILTLIFSVICLQGFQASSINELIFSGKDAKKGQFPFQVLIQNFLKDDTEMYTGGALITPMHVLTGAYFAQMTNKAKVSLGVTEVADTDGVTTYDVTSSDITIHPDYDPNTNFSDIAIIKLPSAVPLSGQINVVLLPQAMWADPTTFDDYNLTISGYGKTFAKEKTIHPVLQFATTHKLKQAKCINHYKKRLQITNATICTDKQYFNSLACDLDNGAPMTYVKDGLTYLIGLFSFRIAYCYQKAPEMWANVPYFLPWIDQIVNIAANVSVPDGSGGVSAA